GQSALYGLPASAGTFYAVCRRRISSFSTARSRMDVIAGRERARYASLVGVFATRGPRMTAIATRVFALTLTLLLTTGGVATRADDDGGGGSCGSVAGDADQVAAVRAAADQECNCASARSHGRYVSCVSDAANDAVQDGRLRKECHGAV